MSPREDVPAPTPSPLLWALFIGSGPERVVAAQMVGEGLDPPLEALLHLPFRPAEEGPTHLTPDQVSVVAERIAANSPILEGALRSALQSGRSVKAIVLCSAPRETSSLDTYLHTRTTLLFELFNAGALRGNDPRARQALLDAFSVLPNRHLSPSGGFLLESQEEERFIRGVPAFGRLTDLTESGGIDKFPSLLSVRGDVLKAHGNRIVPSAMIRDGVFVGRRNIFMFHAAVNIAAGIGDDNLIDSHASVGSAAQIGNDNFLGSFVRIGTGVKLGARNFIAAGVGLSLGTKLRDCREGSPTYAAYTTPRELEGGFDDLAIAPNHATREFRGVEVHPGEILLFENTEEFRARFEGDIRIKGSR